VIIFVPNGKARSGGISRGLDCGSHDLDEEE